MLFVIRGYSALETIEAAERAAALAEKSGNLRQLVNLLIARGVSAVIGGGDLSAASALAGQRSNLPSAKAARAALGAHICSS
jgi:hypothetical protein